jgi:hypothetical protein
VGKIEGVYFLELYEGEKKFIAGFHFLGPEDINS